MRALVTGASGFIGRRLVARLAQQGHEVLALVRPTSALTGLEEAEPVVGDVSDPDLALPPCEVVFHLASLLKVPWKAEFHAVNVDGTRRVARAAARAGARLVVVSSLAAAGPSTAGPHTEEVPARPISIYGRVKRAAEEAAVEHCPDAVIVRPPMVFGPGDRATLGLFRAAARGFCVTPTLRRARVSLVHADDLCSALTLCAEAPPGPLYVAADENLELGELGRRMAVAAGGSARVLRLPGALTWTAAALSEAVARLRDRPTPLSLDKAREVTAGDWTCSNARARQLLGWEPADLDGRLAGTVAWYREQGWM